MFRRTLMNYPHTRLKKSVVATALALAMPLNASADAAYDQLKAQVETLQRQLQQVQQTLDQYQQQSASKEDVAQLEQEVRSASEWKDPDTLIHMAGYADIGYTNANNRFNMRDVPTAGAGFGLAADFFRTCYDINHTLGCYAGNLNGQQGMLFVR